MRKLPIGIQSFEDLRNNGYLYIDKTGYIRKLVESGKVYFLSRPRRFGKSLLLSTMEAYFEGQKELFKGLEIEKYEDSKLEDERWIHYPVLFISMSGGAYKTQTGLSEKLSYSLHQFEDRYGISHQTSFNLPTEFQYCIEEAYRITGKQVVILVDEYDKPLLENMLDNKQQENENRDIFKSFFSVLKDEDKFLKFVFITGVTKFSKVSIFSDLNQLNDISFDPEYAGICGITEDELTADFSEEIDSLAEQNGLSRNECISELRKNYDGYHFSRSPISVYNPFSMLNAFSKHDFGRYWFETGTPTFLYKKLEQSGRPVQDFSIGVKATEARMSDYRAENVDLIPLYYQSGYLTITGFDKRFREYTLAFPNDEVKYGYLESLIPLTNPSYPVPDSGFNAGRMTKYLENDDSEAFMKMLQSLLASIPYYEGKAPENEQAWRNIVYAVFTVLGQYVRAEVHSSNGRSDCIIENDKYVYIFEFKQDKTADEALSQIEEKGYELPYLASKKIIKIGANFSSKIGTIDEWKINQMETP